MKNLSEVGHFALRAAVAAGIAALYLIALYLLYFVGRILLIVFAGVLLGVILDAASSFLFRHTKLRRQWAFALVVLFMLLGILGTAWIGGTMLADQLSAFVDEMPKAIEKVRNALSQNAIGGKILSNTRGPESMKTSEAVGVVTGFFSIAFESVMAIVVVVFMGIYLASNPSLYVDNAARLLPKDKRQRARAILDSLGTGLRRWLAGQVVVMFIVGLITTISFYIIGLPSALILGLITGVLAFVPYIGAISAAVPAGGSPLRSAPTWLMQR